jgi:hypothetical protein
VISEASEELIACLSAQIAPAQSRREGRHEAALGFGIPLATLAPYSSALVRERGKGTAPSGDAGGARSCARGEQLPSVVVGHDHVLEPRFPCESQQPFVLVEVTAARERFRGSGGAAELGGVRVAREATGGFQDAAALGQYRYGIGEEEEDN